MAYRGGLQPNKQFTTQRTVLGKAGAGQLCSRVLAGGEKNLGVGIASTSPFSTCYYLEWPWLPDLSQLCWGGEVLVLRELQ